MPNYCSFELKAVGKKENLIKLHEIMNRRYNCTKNDEEHLWRVFEAEECDNSFEFKNENCDKNEDFIVILGYCAWSVYSCMFDGPGTYQETDETGKGTTISRISKDLELKIEIFSEEPGMCFSEHYLIDNGDIIIDDTVDFYEYCIEEYDTLDDMIKDLELSTDSIPITEEDFKEAKNSSEYIKIGGHEIDGNWIFTI